MGKKTLKILEYKISVISLIWVFIGCLIVINIKPSYSYIDMNNSYGKSSKCYYDKDLRSMWCEAPIKVKQYNKD